MAVIPGVVLMRLTFKKLHYVTKLMRPMFLFTFLAKSVTCNHLLFR